MKKKLLFVIDSLECGGAEKSLTSLLSLIDYEQYDVDLQLCKMDGMFMELVPKSVNILPILGFYNFCNLSFLEQIKTLKKQYIFSRIKLFFMVRLNKNLHTSQSFWKICKNSFEALEKKYDVAIAYGQGFPTYFVAEKVKSKKKIAWVNTDYINAGYNASADKQYYNEFDNIVSVSEEAKNVLEVCFPEFNKKFVVIKDINNAEFINTMANKEMVFQEIDRNIVKIVTVGRLVQLKGYDLAIQSAELLNKEGINFKWYVIGEGPERDNIQKMIRDNKLEDKFVLLGQKSNPYPYIKNCDIYVQTSRYEGFGLAIAEAKILNKIVITTNFDAAYNQINNGKSGIIVQTNYKDIAQNIMKIIEDRRLRDGIIYNLNNEKKGNIEEIYKFYEVIK